MQKLILYSLLAVILGASCQFKLDTEDTKEDDALVIERFDLLQSRYFTTGDYAALQQMSTQYPTETRTLIEDLLQLGEVSDPDINNRLLSFYQDTTLQKIMEEVQVQYVDMSDINQSMNSAFQKLHRLVPQASTPRIYTQIGALGQSIIIGDSAIGISLDKYLGADYQPYSQFYDRQARKTMTRANIVPDCILFYLLSLFPLDDFRNRTHDEREEHMGRAMWATNRILGKTYFSSPQVKNAAEFMREHPRTTIRQLLASD